VSITFSSCFIRCNFVQAQFLGSVTINADGSVTGTNNIHRDGDIYTLTGNISGGIQIQKSNIILDGAGYAVEGAGEGMVLIFQTVEVKIQPVLKLAM
jgi:hypothetical protein